MSELPMGWIKVSLGNLGQYLNGAAFKPSDWTNEGIPIIRIQNLTDSNKPFNHTKKSVSEELLVKNGDILVSWSATLDAFIWDRGEAWLNQHIFRVLPNLGIVEKQFLFFILKREIASLIETEHLHGSTMKHINRGPFLSHSINLPPFNEQGRIVAKLDRLFARSRCAREELGRVSGLVQRYKQAVLAAATLGEFAEDWQTVDIQSVAKVGTGSTPLKSNSSYYADDGIPWITSAATGQPFVTSASEFVTEAAISEHRLKKYPVGTLLVAMYGEGKTRGQVTELRIEATINQACAAIVVDETLALKEYLKLSLQANYLEMRELAEGGNQPNLNLSKIKNFPLFLPPLQQQKEIVNRVEKLFKAIDLIEQEHQKASKLLDRLEQATLSKAFRGELVPQDPNDEPAAVLLERIRGEQQAQPKGKAVKSKQKRGGKL